MFLDVLYKICNNDDVQNFTEIFILKNNTQAGNIHRDVSSAISTKNENIPLFSFINSKLVNDSV
jgi:hypothetical protein